MQDFLSKSCKPRSRDRGLRLCRSFLLWVVDADPLHLDADESAASRATRSGLTRDNRDEVDKTSASVCATESGAGQFHPGITQARAIRAKRGDCCPHVSAGRTGYVGNLHSLTNNQVVRAFFDKDATHAGGSTDHVGNSEWPSRDLAQWVHRGGRATSDAAQCSQRSTIQQDARAGGEAGPGRSIITERPRWVASDKLVACRTHAKCGIRKGRRGAQAVSAKGHISGSQSHADLRH